MRRIAGSEFCVGLALAAALVGLTGCKVGPDYKAAQTSGPASWTSAMNGGLSKAAADVPTVKETAGSSRSGGLVSMLLPRPPGMNDNKTEGPDTKKKEQQVWTMRGGQLAAISFTKGLSDGQQTEVASGQVEPGMELVTEEASAKR